MQLGASSKSSLPQTARQATNSALAFRSPATRQSSVRVWMISGQTTFKARRISSSVRERSGASSKSSLPRTARQTTNSAGAFRSPATRQSSARVWMISGTNSDQGSAYIFVRSGATWSEQQKLTASDGAASDQFGWSVAISGDTAIIGAYLDDIGTNNDQGSAYIFVRSGTVWSQQQQAHCLRRRGKRLVRLQRFDLRRHGDHRREWG